MSLGNNRDYKTNANRVTRNLRAHTLLTARHRQSGLGLAEASRAALQELQTYSLAKIKRIVADGKL
jgi:hypothetical protein